MKKEMAMLTNSEPATTLSPNSPQSPLPPEISRERAREMLGTMVLIRAFEEKAEELYSLGRVHGTMHLSIGQEATAVGASAAMQRGDYLLNHHRGHGHCLAWF